MPHPELKIAAFTLRSEAVVETRPVFEMSLPVEWLAPLHALQAELRNRKDLPNTPPVRALNDVLQTLMPELLAVPRLINPDPERSDRSQEVWLIADRPTPLDTLWLIIRAWLQQSYHTCAAYESMIQTFRQQDLAWRQGTYPLMDTPCENNTAKPHRVTFKSMPAFLADKLIKAEACIPVGKQTCRLMRVPAWEGAELVTWPPVYYTDKKGDRWHYSYTLSITVQTLPGVLEPHIHFHYGVRRWVSHSLMDGGNAKIGRNKRSVYLRSKTPWLEEETPNAFTVSRLRQIKDDTGTHADWDNSVPQVANRLGIAFPVGAEPIADLLQNPTEWLLGNRDVEAAIVDRHPTPHPVQAGLTLDVHKALTDTVGEVLATHLEQCPAPSRLPTRSNQRAHPLAREIRDRSAEERLVGLARSVGEQVVIEVHWTTAGIRDMLVDRIKAVLTGDRPDLVLPPQEALSEAVTGNDAPAYDMTEKGRLPSDEGSARGGKKRNARRRALEPDPQDASNPLEISLPGGGCLHIIPREIGDEGAAFPAQEEGDTIGRREYFRQQTQERACLIKQTMRPAAVPTLALIETVNYQEPRMRAMYGGRDPYSALRLGMAQTGRVTQFIARESISSDKPMAEREQEMRQASLRHRCDSAVRDGLRQLGYLPFPIGFKFTAGPSLPDNLLVVGIWQVRLTKRANAVRVYLPVAVLMDTAGEKVWAWVAADNKGIRPYYQALLDITTLPPQQVQRNSWPTALNQLKQFVEQDLFAAGYKDVVILTEAQNIRQIWNGMENGQIALSGLRFERNSQPQPLTHMRGRLRLIRLRTNSQHETPEWYTNAAQGSKGFTQGLWQIAGAERLYYNIGPKPVTASGVGSKQDKPNKATAIPGVLEILPAILQPTDEPELWANAIDQWRRMGQFSSGKVLRRPLPLDWAQKMDEYAQVIGRWLFPEEWSDEDEDNEDSDDVN